VILEQISVYVIVMCCQKQSRTPCRGRRQTPERDAVNKRLLTYSMEQSPSREANWFAASQEIPRVLWNPKVPHRTNKRPPRIPTLSQPNPILTPTSHFLKIHPNIILPSKPGSSQRSLFPQVSPPKPCTHLSLPPYG
jgi:hypothetical protein